MLEKIKHNNQGFTYVEILISFVIVALVVGPICMSLLAAVKTQVTAKNLGEVTAYAEKLMEDIKYQMTTDIIEQQKVLGGKVKTADIKTDAKDGVGEYLKPWDWSVLSITSTRNMIDIGTFLTDIGTTELHTRYNTGKYAYEIALWRVPEILPVTSGRFKLDHETMKKATKIYTDLSTDYQFKESNYTSFVNPITFDISDEMLKSFKDASLSYVPNQTTDEQKIKVLDLNTITINPSDGSVNNQNKTQIDDSTKDPIIKISSKPIFETGDTKVGYVIQIDEGPDLNTEFPDAASNKSDYRSIIELDLRSILRNSADLSNFTTYDNYTFKFVNNTPYDQIIRVKQNVVGSTEVAQVNTKFNIVVSDKLTTGRSSIVRINDNVPYDNYLVAIIVRDKNPAQGNAGKVIKKMIDIYSYDVTISKRR